MCNCVQVQFAFKQTGSFALWFKSTFHAFSNILWSEVFRWSARIVTQNRGEVKKVMIFTCKAHCFGVRLFSTVVSYFHVRFLCSFWKKGSWNVNSTVNCTLQEILPKKRSTKPSVNSRSAEIYRQERGNSYHQTIYCSWHFSRWFTALNLQPTARVCKNCTSETATVNYSAIPEHMPSRARRTDSLS